MGAGAAPYLGFVEQEPHEGGEQQRRGERGARPQLLGGGGEGGGGGLLGQRHGVGGAHAGSARASRGQRGAGGSAPTRPPHPSVTAAAPPARSCPDLRARAADANRPARPGRPRAQATGGSHGRTDVSAGGARPAPWRSASPPRAALSPAETGTRGRAGRRAGVGPRTGRGMALRKGSPRTAEDAAELSVSTAPRGSAQTRVQRSTQLWPCVSPGQGPISKAPLPPALVWPSTEGAPRSCFISPFPGLFYAIAPFRPEWQFLVCFFGGG